jgi:hypothetical protein
MPDRNLLAEAMAQSGGKSPVARRLLGLPIGVKRRAASSGDSSPAQSSSETPSPAQALQDELFRRMLFSKDVGFGIPGPGTIPGSALRKDVRDLFEDEGGVVAIDITKMSPEVERALSMLLDRDWAVRHSGG